ncbi:MAG TPA: LysE family translocator [Aliidongia sp.]|uniref:LysE family translocator n=1 Tax=Aliidongia sp. TaxID=1914230 RepID=UPI002DDD5D95|nr:LysE family translocator [Aliidongia sp.]HEV2674257.1 LysE family translocator [Aliidongia sp.]
MSFDHWLAFAVTSAIMLAIPGPTVLLVVSYALGQGRRSGLATTAGVALGDFTAMTASMLGLGVLLATSSALFTGLRWIGAAYLIYLGVKLWRMPVGDMATAAAAETKSWRMFLHAYAVTALNPKSILFFVAFLPQFFVASAPVVPQMVLFEITFLVLATLNSVGYVLLAAAARRAVRRPEIQRRVNRVGGSMLIGAGLFAAAWKKAA